MGTGNNGRSNPPQNVNVTVKYTYKPIHRRSCSTTDVHDHWRIDPCHQPLTPGNERGQFWCSWQGEWSRSCSLPPSFSMSARTSWIDESSRTPPMLRLLPERGFLALPACKPVGGVQPPCPEAVAAAIAVATQNGYTDGLGGRTVTVNIPPNAQSQFAGFPGHIQVVLGGSRGSFFAGFVGDLLAERDRPWPSRRTSRISRCRSRFSRLNETECDSVHITGNGTININADIQVNSTCDTSGALQVGGRGATVNAATATCSTSGTIKVNSGTLNCNQQEVVEPQFFPAIGGPGRPTDPHGAESSPDRRQWQQRDPRRVPGLGGTPSTEADSDWMHDPIQQRQGDPNLPGTLLGRPANSRRLAGARTSNVYMEPGIYYIAGGGFEIAGDIVVRTVAPWRHDVRPGESDHGRDDLQHRRPDVPRRVRQRRYGARKRVHQYDRLPDRGKLGCRPAWR